MFRRWHAGCRWPREGSAIDRDRAELKQFLDLVAGFGAIGHIREDFAQNHFPRLRRAVVEAKGCGIGGVAGQREGAATAGGGLRHRARDGEDRRVER